MTLNEEILEFTGKLITWQAQAAKKLADMEVDGDSTSREYDEILKDSIHVIELIAAIYVTDIELIDEDDEVKLNYLTDSDADIRLLMSNWSYYLTLNLLPVGILPKDGQYFVKSENITVVGSGLPSGGGQEYILGQDSNGIATWILKPTIFEMDETV